VTNSQTNADPRTRAEAIASELVEVSALWFHGHFEVADNCRLCEAEIENIRKVLGIDG
jgi:hypothetical protein